MTPPAFTDDDPADPDRAWAFRDCGDGAEEAEDVDELEPIGPVDTDESYAAAESRFPALVTPVFTAFRTGAGAHSSDERRECPNTVCR